MSTKFNLPVVYGSPTYSDEKTLKITSNPTSRVISPYDGIITNTSGSLCNGQIKIKHNIMNKTYYSYICGVDIINVFPGTNVKKGETIGFTGTDDILFELKNDTNQKQKLKPFFVSGISSENDTKNTETKPKSKEPIKGTEKDETGLLDLILGVGLKPFGFVHSALKEDKEKIKEDINRIKKLL